MKKLFLFLFLFLFLLVILTLSGCVADNAGGSHAATAYYTDKNKQTLIPVDVYLEADNIPDAANEIFMMLYVSPQQKLYPALPKRVKLIDLSVSKTECRLTLSPEYLSLPAPEKTLLNGTLSKTLCSLDGIDKVLISSENKTFNLSPDDFLTELPKTFYESHLITLYYPQNGYSSVKKESATISLSPSETLEKAAVMLLKNPPPALESPFPEGCEIYDVYMDGSVCVLNLSDEFVSNAIHKKKQETILIFSIVNTLTELPGVDKVKFLIDSKPSFGYIYYNISTPLRNSSNLFKINT